MGRHPDSGQLDLAQVFGRVQQRLLADLAVGRSFEHPTAAGNASEQLWRDLFARYLPKRFSAAPAFVINSAGQRSQQIDLAIFDNLHTPLLFPHAAGDHIPIESVCAVFEIKQTISKQFLRDAGEKAASVRALTSSRRRVLAGLLATSSVWKPGHFEENVQAALESHPKAHAIHYGCALEHGAFENLSTLTTVSPDQSLIFFLLRLIHQLNTLRPPPPINLLDYLPH
jgi:hypothetical protein